MESIIKKRISKEYIPLAIGFLTYGVIFFALSFIFKVYPAQIIDSAVFKNGLAVNVIVYTLISILINALIALFANDKTAWFIISLIGIFIGAALSFLGMVVVLAFTWT